MEKLFAIGDIHGCYLQLVKLMERLAFDARHDTLVFLGDYINRGPQSRQVIDFLLQVKSTCPRSVFLMGNHEHLLLSYAATGDVEILHNLRGMGAEETLKSYDHAPVRSLLDLSFLPPAHLEFFRSLQVSFRWGPYLFVHADEAEENSSEAHLGEVLASRRLVKECQLLEGCVRVFGHSPLETPLVAPDRIGIDTGAAHGNLLTAVELPALRFYHAG
ncbi:MAG: metallophosphoesterase family protein [Desulfobacteraceae bacterium]|nr:metallophosphoesterase family protein [Desulfobacteraceae bacterium]